MSKRKLVRVVETPAIAERDPRPPVEAIRAAAFTQFAERGYPVVTVRDIMKACGLTQGALYNHFKSKDELLHDIIASTQGELERQCQQAVAGAGDDPRAKLAAFVRAYVVRHCRLRVEALVANRDLLPDIMAQAKKIAATRYLSTSTGETLHSSFPPTVDVYHELSMERTIVEIQARDQIGLLYRLGKTISDHGFDITFARIGTERGVAIDTFYIESANREVVDDKARLEALREELNEVIAPVAAVAAK